jgi:hypothetical protein
MEVMTEFGYAGEEGFVRFQAQLMEHAQDPVMQANAAALMAVYERAKMT